MLKNTLLLTLISVSFLSCTIRGNYYLINSSSKNVKVSIELNPWQTLMKKELKIKGSKRSKRKVKYSAYKKMKPLKYTVDSLTSIVHFELRGNHVAFLGSSNNAREIGQIKILDNGQTYSFDSNKGKFKSRGFMKYVMLYKYE